jgi:general stress protein YciG
MDEEERREIARKGGKASHGNRGEEDEEEEEGRAGRGTRGGSSEQHARAGRQSHKNR